MRGCLPGKNTKYTHHTRSCIICVFTPRTHKALSFRATCGVSCKERKTNKYNRPVYCTCLFFMKSINLSDTILCYSVILYQTKIANLKTCCLITFLLQFPYFGYGFSKNSPHIRRICFKIFASPRSKSENFAAKIIKQQVLFLKI